jgi:hypothetical protein
MYCVQLLEILCVLFVEALRAIEKGEEIFVSYNYDPDNSFTPRYDNSSNVELYARPFNICEFQTIFEQETNLYLMLHV